MTRSTFNASVPMFSRGGRAASGQKDLQVTEPLILVTGSTGVVGTETVRQLTEAGRRVRALVRDPAKATKLDPRAEIVLGDLADPLSLAPAFAGVEKVFVISNGADLDRLETNAFDAAKRAGANYVVKLSGRGVDWPAMRGAATARWHGESERRLKAMGLAWTILRPGFLASNVFVMNVMANGGFFLPLGDGRDAVIDPYDVAAVAVKALTEPGHDGKIYELTGPELLSFQEIVDKLAAFTGASLIYVDVPAAVALEGMLNAGMPADQAEAAVRFFAEVRAGKMVVQPTVTEVLGRRARSFDDWLRGNAAALGI
jgi:uncharacterized protein YbjT (DUF2867 family)